VFGGYWAATSCSDVAWGSALNGTVRLVRLHPVVIDRCQTRHATEKIRDEIIRRMAVQCRALRSFLSPDDVSSRINA
jgi:hypothetical protein